MTGFSLLLAFDRDTPDFALGFEIGRAWTLLDASDDALDMEMHASGAEMILRLAEATGRKVTTEQHDDTWVTAFFSERAA